MTPITENKVLTVNPGRGLAEYSNPCDPATFTGVNGLHYNRVLNAVNVLAGLPLAVAGGTGAVYLSNIHGGLGSDANNPQGVPVSGLNPNTPAFANPDATGYYIPPDPNANNPVANAYNNTEKVLRSPSDNPAGNGTIWQSTNGRQRLNFALWLSDNTPGSASVLELYRDLNANDKVAGRFGAGTGPTDLQNAMLVAQWRGKNAPRDQPMPSHCTSIPYEIPAGCNLYLLFRNLNGNPTLAIGSVWLS